MRHQPRTTGDNTLLAHTCYTHVVFLDLATRAFSCAFTVFSHYLSRLVGETITTVKLRRRPNENRDSDQSHAGNKLPTFLSESTRLGAASSAPEFWLIRRQVVEVEDTTVYLTQNANQNRTMVARNGDHTYAKTDRVQYPILARMRSHFIFRTLLHFS